MENFINKVNNVKVEFSLNILHKLNYNQKLFFVIMNLNLESLKIKNL